MQHISVIGSTGSVGTQTLNVIARYPEHFTVSALCARNNTDLLKQQLRRFRPRLCVVCGEGKEKEFAPADFPGTEFLFGEKYMTEAAVLSGVHTVVAASAGIAALPAVLAALRAKKRVALANKEVIVSAGGLVMAEAERSGAELIPVDSEHSAVFQCLMGQDRESLRRILLTASGGPFLHCTQAELEQVTPERALKHPNWDMGKKITVDSATLMNKGLEVIEARWLFGVPPHKIEVAVHPQSIVHSMVEFTDGAVMAQLSRPSMELPILFALQYPQRCLAAVPPLDFTQMLRLEFLPPDTVRFPCLRLAYDALRGAWYAPLVLSAADEAAVSLFLSGEIGFTDIPRMIERCMERLTFSIKPSPESVYYIDNEVRAAIGRVKGELLNK